MTEKETAEIRRRFKKDKINISKIHACYVNDKGEIISKFEQVFSLMSQDESEELLNKMKKVLSGTMDKNLINLEFTTKQVMENDEHGLLMAIKNSSAEDSEAVGELFNRISHCLHIEGNYMIILACDKYDVPSYTKDGNKEEDSAEVFTYFVCCVCPIKLTKPALGFKISENTFKNITSDWVVGVPELGFMFPSFDDRSANIYNTLYYTKNTAENHSDFIDEIFKTPIPMAAEVQKETFGSILEETVGEDCSFEVAAKVRDNLYYIIEEHKESKEEEPLSVTGKQMTEILENSGVSAEKVTAFGEKFNSEFGEDAAISPVNIINTKQFEVKTADVSIKVNPDRSDLLKTQIINGTKYILIRADNNVEVNGVNIHIKDEQESSESE